MDDISFDVDRGMIMGLIGRNGAGKTTTLKSILNLICISGGEIMYLGKSLRENDAAIKEQIGYAGGAVDYYKKKKIRDIVRITKTFYGGWSDALYEKYADLFELDGEKTPSQLSEGVRIKLNLAILSIACIDISIGQTASMPQYATDLNKAGMKMSRILGRHGCCFPIIMLIIIAKV